MGDYINASVQSLYHLFGHSVPSVLSSIVVDAPKAAKNALLGAPANTAPDQGRWLVAASAGNNNNYKKFKASVNGSSAASNVNEDNDFFDSMKFFGLRPNKDPRRSAYGFTDQQYPYPLYSGHYHTIVGGARKSISSKKMGYEREVIKNTTFDGNTLFLEWKYCSVKKIPDGPKGVVALVPGLCSGPNSNYVQRFVNQCVSNGFHVVVLVIRGMGSAPLEFGNMTAGTFTHDIKHTLEEHLTEEYIEKKFGKRDLKLIAVGFSLGGAMLANYLGDAPKTRLFCAVAAEAPWDFHLATSMMSTRFAKILYQPALMKGLWNVIRKTGENIIEHTKSDTLRKNMLMLQGKLKKKGGMAGYTVNDFDNIVVAPAQGFPSASAYYTAASPFQRLGKITIPLLCFSALDDPITGEPPAIQEWNAVCNHNHNIVHVRCPSGGHLGFMRGPLDEFSNKPGFMDEFIVRCLVAAVDSEQMLSGNDTARTTFSKL